MDELEQKLQRTWVQLLIDHNFREAAAIAIDTEVCIFYDGYDPEAIALDLPASVFGYVKSNDKIKSIMERALSSVCHGRLYRNNGTEVGDLPFRYRVKLIEVEEGWQNVIRGLIADSQNPNQGVITEKAFLRDNKQPYTYNEMKFASQSEIRIAQEFESRHILFFPLPLAVRSESGNFFEDHREVDFLVCQDGTWGILEVSYHPDRYEKDAEKDSWFKKSGILCVQHYSAERCYNTPADVAKEFLAILAKHKR